MDYGHELEFGVFITPTNRPPEQPVRLAQLAEQEGFDLATFQDHPYQPAFHDTWTLMSWIAASTTRIRIAPNVLNVPLRQPAVVARSAASLDLLSGGRFELGLGSGGFWDAIEAMGGERLTPGQGVDALAEAIAIIRGIWDTSERGGLRVDGEHHRVAGAKRGPRPTHPIPLHIGAYKPRMLRLTGRLGDGWLPSLGYMQPGDLGRGNQTIDEAAARAGRDPREIRRLLNIGGAIAERSTGRLQGPPDQWVEELVDLALTEGVGTFILAADEPTLMQRFMAEVAPAVREQVEAERAERGTDTSPAVPTAVLAKRVEGLDYGAIPASLKATAVEPGSWQYPDAQHTYLRGGAPAVVLRPTSAAQVADALGYARSQGAALLGPGSGRVPLSIRSAGHGISGRSTNHGGIVVDVGALNRIDVVDAQRRLVRIGAGATWGEVATALDEHGWAITSGDYGGVGVGGLATAGGIGFLGREHGLTIDHIESIDVVLAGGDLVRASRDEHPELFWGMRGAGANLGVAVAFEMIAQPVGEIGFAQLAFDASDTADFLTRWGATTEAADRAVTPFLLLGRDQPGRSRIAQAMIAVDAADPETIVGHLQPFAMVAPLVQQQVVRTRYAGVIDNAPGGAHQGQGEPTTRSALLRSITPDVATALARFLDAGAHFFFQVRAMGGAIADVPADATAFAHRDAGFSVIAFGMDRTRLDAAWDTLVAPHASGLYLSFETDQRPGRLEDAFPPATLARLRALKAEVDPENLFRDNFNVAAPAAAPSR